MTKLRLAILDEQLEAELTEFDPSDLDGVQIVWKGTKLSQFRAEVPAIVPDAIAIDLGALGEDPVPLAHDLAEETGAQMVFVLYTFAKRSLLSDLSGSRVRPVRAPLSLQTLRGFLSGMLVRKILSRPQSETITQRAPLPAPERPRTPQTPEGIPLVRYSRAQLGRLRQIKTVVECECPSHLADLLTMLVAFEQYSASCTSRNTKDREIHAMLHRETADARARMEDALSKLLDHEDITL